MHIEGYDLRPGCPHLAKKINNILVANHINHYQIQVSVRYNYMVVYWMWVPFGDYLHIEAAIEGAVNALQKKFGPDLPVQDNYAEAKRLKPRPREPFACNERERKIYGCLCD